MWITYALPCIMFNILKILFIILKRKKLSKCKNVTLCSSATQKQVMGFRRSGLKSQSLDTDIQPRGEGGIVLSICFIHTASQQGLPGSRLTSKNLWIMPHLFLLHSVHFCITTRFLFFPWKKGKAERKERTKWKKGGEGRKK